MGSNYLTRLLVILAVIVLGVSLAWSHRLGSSTTASNQHSVAELPVSLTRLGPTYASEQFGILAVSVLESGSIWAVGYDGRNNVWHSGDRGMTWERLRLGPRPDQIFYSVFFFDNLNGWICGSGGVVMRTSDGGRRWDYVPTTKYSRLVNIRFANTAVGFAVADQDPSNLPNNVLDETPRDDISIFRTENAGASWERCFFDLHVGRPADLVVRSINEAAVLVWPGNLIFRTLDGGEKWERIELSPRLKPARMKLDPDGAIWLVGQETLVRSGDFGSTWVEQDESTVALDKQVWTDISFRSDGFAVLIGSQSFLAVSADGGKRWERKATDFLVSRPLSEKQAQESFNQVQLAHHFGIIVGSKNFYLLEVKK